MLKSGGPLMTIENIGDYSGRPGAFCIWFDKTEKKSGVFQLNTLERSEE